MKKNLKAMFAAFAIAAACGAAVSCKKEKIHPVFAGLYRPGMGWMPKIQITLCSSQLPRRKRR